MKWGSVSSDEQETVISIDYFERKLYFYTTKQSVARRIAKRIGKPNKVTIIDGKICAVLYERDLSNNEIKIFLSKTTTIGAYIKQKGQNDEIH